MFCENGFDECDYDPATDSDETQRTIRIERFVERAKAPESDEHRLTMDEIFSCAEIQFQYEFLEKRAMFCNEAELINYRNEWREMFNKYALIAARKSIK